MLPVELVQGRVGIVFALDRRLFRRCFALRQRNIVGWKRRIVGRHGICPLENVQLPGAPRCSFEAVSAIAATVQDDNNHQAAAIFFPSLSHHPYLRAAEETFREQHLIGYAGTLCITSQGKQSAQLFF
jgi:hypothetical protein